MSFEVVIDSSDEDGNLDTEAAIDAYEGAKNSFEESDSEALQKDSIGNEEDGSADGSADGEEHAARFTIKDPGEFTLPERLMLHTSDLASMNGPGVAVFQCPAPSCQRSCHCRYRLTDLYTHAKVHADEFFMLGCYICEVGCAIGFVDEFDRINHYREGLCNVRLNKFPKACGFLVDSVCNALTTDVGSGPASRRYSLPYVTC